MSETMRVIVVDDSVVFRSQIKAALEGVPGISIVAVAANGRIALDRLEQHGCDLMVLDMEMPEMNGIETLAALRRLGLPTKVIVFASPTKDGAAQAMEALRSGADDFVAKPTGGRSLDEALAGIREELVPKILQFRAQLKAAGREQTLDGLGNARPPAPQAAPASAMSRIAMEVFRPHVMLIGSSTGGPAALERIFAKLKGLPVNVPILIAQHMPPHFTECLARRLETLSGLPACEGRSGQLIESGRIYVAPGDHHMTVKRSSDGKNCMLMLDQTPKRNSVRPAVDFLFESAAQTFLGTAAAFVLTGMGEDGAQGARAVKAAGGCVMIQDRESSVVWGMPGAVSALGAFDAIGDLDECARIAAKLVS